MVESSASQAILDAVQRSSLRGFALREFAMEQLDSLPTYDWSGIYRLEGDTLVLDAYVGAHTDHTHIPVGRGVCGTAVAEDANQVIDDVRELSNYLSCSINTRSEIVVLIKRVEGLGSGVEGVSGDPAAPRLVGDHKGQDEAVIDTSTPEQRLVTDQPVQDSPSGSFLASSPASGEHRSASGNGVGSAEQFADYTPIPTLPPQLREGEGLLDSTQLPTILGQIDIDGHQVGAFDESDEAFLTELGKILAERWAE